MKSYSFTDMNKIPGQVLDEAMKGPVALTKHGRERLVILPAERFHRLMGQPTPTAHSVYDRTPENTELGEAIDATLRELDGEPK